MATEEQQQSDTMSTDGESSFYTDSECDILSDSDDDFQGDLDVEIENYVLKEKIGKGGFGVVWACEKDGEPYALKIGKVNEETTREVDVLKKLGKHEHTIEMLQFFWHTVSEKEKHLILVFPQYDTDLEEYIRKCEGMSLKDVQETFPKILKGVQHIHNNNITHTDLKPNNILINVDDDYRITDLVITDFGCASWDGAVCKYGKTSCYRSVNIILNEAASPEDDIWSLGCILFEMFTNQYLFDPDIPKEGDEDEEMEEDSESDDDDEFEVNRLHLMLMLEILGPFPRKLALKHREYFNAKGTLKGNPKFNKLDMSVIFKEESSLAEEYIPVVCRLISSMMKYTKRQRSLIHEIIDDPLFQ